MYQCPVCRGEVILRIGQRYVPHFAHRHETAKPECELYTPGERQPDPHRKPVRPFIDDEGIVRNTVRVLPPQLVIEVEENPSSGQRQLPRWNLCVTLPKSINDRGSVAFDFGTTPLRRIELSKLFGGQVTHVANPNANYFRAVWCSPETNPVYREKVAERLPGLNKQGVTPFENVRARFKPRARRLVWGRAYYFVWPKAIDPEFPSAFEALTIFDDNRDWSCALNALPASRDEYVAGWVEKFCSVNIENPSTTWSLLYPFLSAYAYDGYIETPAVGRLIVGYDDTGEAEATKSKARTIGSGEPIETFLASQSRSVVALTYSDSAPDAFELVGNFQFSLRFRALESGTFTNQPKVWGVFDSPINGLVQVALHTAAARRWLTEVRAGQAEVVKIALPKIVRGELAWRSSPISAWNCSSLNRRSGEDSKSLDQVILAREELEHIQTILRSTSDEVRISFGGLGEHHFHIAEVGSDRTIHLPRQLRNRMLWLQKEVSIAWRNGRPVADNISDGDLIQSFLALTPPPALVAHYHSIQQSLGDATLMLSRWGIS